MTYRVVRFRYTHGFDLLGQVIAFFGSLFALTGFADAFGWFGLVPGLLVALGFYWLFTISPLKHFLYARLSLRTPVSWADIKQLQSLFEPSISFEIDLVPRWQPMTEVLTLPKHLRRDALFRAIDPKERVKRHLLAGMTFSSPEERAKAIKSIDESLNR